MGKFTALPRSPIWTKGEGEGRYKGGEGNGKDKGGIEGKDEREGKGNGKRRGVVPSFKSPILPGFSMSLFCGIETAAVTPSSGYRFRYQHSI